MSKKRTNGAWIAKLADLLKREDPEDYLCAADACESLVDDLGDEVSVDDRETACEIIETWYADGQTIE